MTAEDLRRTTANGQHAAEFEAFTRIRSGQNHETGFSVTSTSSSGPSASPESEAASSDSRPAFDRCEQLRKFIGTASALLPAQGPITAFVFLNTLQALEHLPFHDGLREGARLFGCQPYLSEDRYRAKYQRGRIQRDDLIAALHELPGNGSDDSIAGLTTRRDLRLAMLEFPLRHGPDEELRWFIAETSALTRMRDETPAPVREQFLLATRHWIMRDLSGLVDHARGRSQRPPQQENPRVEGLLSDLFLKCVTTSLDDLSDQEWETLTLQVLWRICRQGIHGLDLPVAHHDDTRHRDLLLAAVGQDTDELVHPVLIRFCAAFTDQGLADWELPHREEGFFRCFSQLYQQSGGPPDRWMRSLAEELRRIEDSGLSPLQCLQESLDLLGVRETEHERFLTASLLALRGWAGMIHQMEARPDRVPRSAPEGTLIEFLAVRLILERLALTQVAEETLYYRGPLSGLKHAARHLIPRIHATTSDERAFLVFQIAQVLGWTPQALLKLTRADWSTLLRELETFNELERRKVFHVAFEQNFWKRALDALSVHTRVPARRVQKPGFQAVFCIDAREESFRRHLQEVAPDTETFGAAGFFVVPIYYRGVAEAHFSTLCPIVVKPQHWIVEEPVYSLGEQHRRRARTRQMLGTAHHQLHSSSRSIARGALVAAGVGVFASIPLVARVLFPRLTARIRRTASQFVEPPPVTRLRLERHSDPPGPEGDHIGFRVPEMANIAERMLRDIGLISNFSRLVMFLGHGSFCLNNPHKSAYDCGACSGSAGGPNARALAAMLNDPRVRTVLAERGLPVPDDTFFLGGLHNTCNDSVTFFDLDLLPRSHHPDFECAEEILEQTCERNAHERCRRFHSASLDLSFSAAHRHVEERSEDLAQVRPEFGNASNAMCFVGRGERIRGLYLDRRSFLHSYDAAQDDSEATILGRILGAVVVVCSGINLQYFFSYIDSPGWGAGTKLPHNVTSLLGVMDGAASDLRMGLPWQGVEIHEPVRLLLIVEASPEALFKVMSRSETVDAIIRNDWIKLVVLDPQSNRMQLFANGKFEPYQPGTEELPRAASSLDWYRGWRDHLGFAAIEGAPVSHDT